MVKMHHWSYHHSKFKTFSNLMEMLPIWEMVKLRLLVQVDWLFLSDSNRKILCHHWVNYYGVLQYQDEEVLNGQTITIDNTTDLNSEIGFFELTNGLYFIWKKDRNNSGEWITLWITPSQNKNEFVWNLSSIWGEENFWLRIMTADGTSNWVGDGVIHVVYPYRYYHCGWKNSVSVET